MTALSRSIDGASYGTAPAAVITGQIDFARSSSGPKGNGTALSFIPFAQDAVSYAVTTASDFPRDIPVGSSSNTTQFSLYNIYHCIKTSYVDKNLNTVTINPLIPQSGSGTAKFWISTLSLNPLPTCVHSVNNGVSVQEHDGTSLTGPGDIAPFSIAQYLAQGNHAAIATATGVNVVERRGQVSLGSVGTQRPVIFDGTTGALVMNPAFPINRLVYNVVASSRLSETAIANTFVGNGSAVCSHPEIIQQFGFATIGSACGTVAGTQALG